MTRRRRVPRFAALLVGALSSLVLAAQRADAQELEPRAYTNTPVGLNFLVTGYGYQAGDVVTDPGLPLDDAKVHVHTAFAAYARSFGLLGTSAKADVILPYSFVDGSARLQDQRVARQIDGAGDPRVRASVNFYGAPALTLPEFASYHQNLIVGGSFQMTIPIGKYHGSKLLNIGTNRWSFKPELGISKALGPFILEAAPSVTFYTPNDDFFGKTRRTQDPLYAVQTHLVYRVSEALWGSFDSTYYAGGRTAVDGRENANRQSNARVGITAALSLSRHHSLKLYASKAVATRVGGDFDQIGAAFQLRWGGGL